MSESSLFPVKPRPKASVLLPMPLPEPFDYEIPDDVTVKPGDHVLVPLGQRTASGVVWAVSEETDPKRKLKPIDGLRGGPPLVKGVRDFIDWTARYLVEPPGVVLRHVLRNPAALKPSPVETIYTPTGQQIARMTPARTAILQVASTQPASAAELARQAGVSSSVVKGLFEAGALKADEVPVDPPFEDPDPYQDGLQLNDQQEAAARVLRKLVAAGGFQAALIDGVTGSGKTEVYFDAIAELLRREAEAQILVLLPEIALTQAVTARFAERFGAEPVIWHSSLSDKERRRAWREAASGRAKIIAGARSSIFLPLPNLRAIIVDEEHDPTYKQSDALTYSARDLAVARAKLGGALCILASATPSMESMVNAEAGRYHHIRLAGRAGGAVLPDIELLDLRQYPPEKGQWLSQPLIETMRETLQRGEQTLLYLNRRGFAPLVLCKSCGHKMKSPEADTWLVEHRYTGRLVCHVTGFSMPKPRLCPECKAEDSLIGIGPGVERVAEETAQKFPGARIEVFSSDTARSADAVRDLVKRMEDSQIDILVGTQIAAKGHNFPNLTLVGVVDADLGLAGGDLRAGERTYQTLVQAAGRAGRADRPGRAILQTWKPEHEALQALARQDRDAFLNAEKLMRETLGLPPYGRLAALILSAPDPQLVDDTAQAIAKLAPAGEGVQVFGPAEPPLGVVRGRWRRRFLIQGQKNTDMSAYMRAWMARVKAPSSVRIRVDIEPYSFL